MMCRVLLSASFFLAIPVSFAQQTTQEEREILYLQDQRSLGNGKLVSYLSSTDSKLRARAAIALANLQDTSSTKDLTPLLKDSDVTVRASAAFALGQIGSRSSCAPLLESLRSERDAVAARRILEALGRCGDQSCLDSVIAFIPRDPQLRGEQALTVAKFALRSIKSERSVWFCFDLLGDPDAEVQWRALYSLWRSAPYGLIDVEISKRREELTKLASSSCADVRMHLATLLGRSKSSDAPSILFAIEKSEKERSDWRVQVQTVRSLGAFAPREPALLSKIIGYLGSPNEHVKIATLQVFTALTKETVEKSEQKARLKKALNTLALSGSREVPLLQGEALVALGKLFPEELKKKADILANKGVASLVKAKYLEGLSFNPSSEVLKTFLRELANDSVRVSMAAWDFAKRLLAPATVNIIKSGYPRWPELPSLLFEKARSSLNRNDMGVSTVVANAVADSGFFALFRGTEFADKIVQELMSAYLRFKTPNDVEAMQAILGALGSTRNRLALQTLEKALTDPDRTVGLEAAQALQRITGQDYMSRVPAASKPSFSDYDWKAFDALKPDQKVALHTSKGTIKLELMKQHAPFTVLSFVKLVKKRFYNGLTFHRVVPNFVVQGGDPRGDGWGGPGYSIRSEYGLVNYERGSVGVASAGKDTEGCQFFITHSPQPHLDGRYTIFATVVEGMDVVDQLQVGDKIVLLELTD